MDKKIKKKITVAAIVVIMVFCYFSIPGKKVSITVQNGEGASLVAADLKRNELIISKNLFVVLVKFSGSQNKIKAGVYEFRKNNSMFQILSELKSGSKNMIRFTIPEGSTVGQTAEIISAKVGISKDKFIEVAKVRAMEGYLMPETYMVDPSMKEEDIINMMQREFDKKITPQMYERAKEINMPMKKVIILASIIEKEAVKPNERPIISAVFHNRLKKRIRLESCATVLYAMGINKAHLSIEDTKFDSPYNTYKIFGLPPAPICSPGIESIKAALYPADTNSLYFVAAGDGSSLFADSLEGHIKNKRAVRN
ncbi:endolytic transglycosylase MltG [Endomicrobium proavitum]|uniref:Endolytic murein transglycosylase n=1 Tax=Endomicrobium proavitum TaxID=1408281 RepID=A0A0G3WJR2_9BACT|nr:endolytic transglycosylase MltG [Endomicrobium proavitum]AKL98102.1 hypothetical protein Epro_0723 [Endomicrobium proavitum]